MAKNKPFKITEHEDKTVTLNIDGISKTFRNLGALAIFADNLAHAVSERRTGMFRLQDNGSGLDLMFNKGGEVLHAKNYDDMALLAEKILETTGFKVGTIW